MFERGRTESKDPTLPNISKPIPRIQGAGPRLTAVRGAKGPGPVDRPIPPCPAKARLHATVVEAAISQLRLLKEREVDPGQLDEIGVGRLTADNDKCPGVVKSAVPCSVRGLV